MMALGLAAVVSAVALVMLTVIGNMILSSRRLQVQNEADSMMLNINQILANGPACGQGLRMGSGARGSPYAGEDTFDFAEVRVGGDAGAAAYRVGQILPWPAGATAPILPNAPTGLPAVGGGLVQINRIWFERDTGVPATVHNILDPQDDPSEPTPPGFVDYTRYVGTLKVDLGYVAGVAFFEMLGGTLRPREVPLTVMTRTGTNQIDLCYTRESMDYICMMMGGFMNNVSNTPGAGKCNYMVGNCAAGSPNDPVALGACDNAQADIAGRCLAPSIEAPVRFVQIVEGTQGMRFRCACRWTCVVP